MKRVLRRGLRSLPILLALGSPACRPARPPEPLSGAGPVVSCRPDRTAGLTIPENRSRFCLIDVGSRNVKLILASLHPGLPLLMKDERQCRTRMQLGDKVFDQKTQTARPLPEGDLKALVALMNDYVAMCERDGGRMVGATASEWARRATNPDDIRKAIETGTGMEVEILTREREGRYGYLSATRGLPGKIVLDFGSRSFQLSYWPKDQNEPLSVSVPIGIDESGDRFFGKKEYTDFAGSRAAFLAAVKNQMEPTLRLIQGELKKGTLKPELFSLGENGDVPLALAGRLWDGANKGVDEAALGALLKTQQLTATPQYGIIAALVPSVDVATLATNIEGNAALFNELRGDRIKRVYGNKMLAFPALVTMLTTELGLPTVILVPQELSDGFIIEKLNANLR